MATREVAMLHERIVREKIAVMDFEPSRRHKLVRSLSEFAYGFPLESVSELVDPFPNDAILLVHYEEGLIERCSETVSALGEWLPIVAYKERPNAQEVVGALREGAMNFMDWPLGRQSLRDLIFDFRLQAHRNEGRATSSIVATRKLSRLSGREQEIFDAVLTGHSSRRIADNLGVSVRTVEVHRSNVLKKIGAKNTADAVRIGLEAGLPWSKLKDICG